MDTTTTLPRIDILTQRLQSYGSQFASLGKDMLADMWEAYSSMEWQTRLEHDTFMAYVDSEVCKGWEQKNYPFEIARVVERVLQYAESHTIPDKNSEVITAQYILDYPERIQGRLIKASQKMVLANQIRTADGEDDLPRQEAYKMKVIQQVFDPKIQLDSIGSTDPGDPGYSPVTIPCVVEYNADGSTTLTMPDLSDEQKEFVISHLGKALQTEFAT